MEKVLAPVDNELAATFDHFEVLVNKLRNDLTTYRRFNLKPLLHKTISALCTLSCAICHPTDKGLSPYVAYQPNYMNQGIKEHLDHLNKYTRLSSIEATAELGEQKKLFYEAFIEYKDWLSPELQQYFERSFKKHLCFGGNRNMLLYLLWKVCKDKTYTRPVILSCGSFSEILSIYVNKMLQSFLQDMLLLHLISSDQLLCILSEEFPTALPLRLG